ncbi:hypothetical protein [Bradyrhizobium sp. F1.13.3]|uniref:hypothetical protein n=1 Tax=Bradyrhizobium sp. F1.13.3 TaxID=3156351 RepID=UPI003391FAAA
MNEIVAALADISKIDSYETLAAEMADWFSGLAALMATYSDKRPSQTMHKMAATIHTVPYDLLAEFGHSYNPTLLAFVILLHCSPDMPDYGDARALVQALLDDLRQMDLDRPEAQNAIERTDAIFDRLSRLPK